MGKRILIVDDFRDGAISLAELLGDYGYEVETAFSGEACLARLAAAPPVDVLFIDIDMPGTNGAQVIRKLMEQVPLPALKIVALTAWGAGWESEWGPPGWSEDDRYRQLVVATSDKTGSFSIPAMFALLGKLIPEVKADWTP